MNHDKDRLAEKMLVFLYSLSASTSQININTFKRYIYLYYLTESFLNGGKDNISITIDKGDIKIVNFESIIDDFSVREYINVNDNLIQVTEILNDLVDSMLNNKGGAFYALFKEINPFVNLLKSYNDQFIFTIFFSEPTFNQATQRGLKELTSANSKLTTLLEKFKKKIRNSNIDEYDILTYWMDFILKNYYSSEGKDNNAVE